MAPRPFTMREGFARARGTAAISPLAGCHRNAISTIVVPQCSITQMIQRGRSRPGSEPPMDKDTSASAPRPEGDATAGLRDHRYPEGTFAGLIGTPFVTAPTRAALEARMAKPAATAPRFLDAGEFALLGAVCDRLLDQDGDERRIDVPGAIDARLASGETDGWRYDALPDDGAAMKRGLAGFDETARAMAGRGFLDLSADDRDRVIDAVAGGDPAGAAWAALPARRFFEDLLAAATESFYAHPLAQEEIGYVGYADARGWQAIELGEREPREPEPVGGAGVEPRALPPSRRGRRRRDRHGRRRRAAAGAARRRRAVGRGAGGRPGARPRPRLRARRGGPGLPVLERRAPQRRRRPGRLRPQQFRHRRRRLHAALHGLYGPRAAGRPAPEDRLRRRRGLALRLRGAGALLRRGRGHDRRVRPLALSLGPGPHALSAEAAAAQRRRAADAAGLRDARHPHLAGRQRGAVGLLSRPTAPHFRPACHNCGFCQAGCATGAKGSADVTWLPLAVRPAPRSARNATSRASSATPRAASPPWCTARRAATSASAAATCSSAPAPSRRPACCC